jgi:hypothetical protein
LCRRRIIRENEQQYLREKARREAELTQKLVRTSEGPAHHIVHVSVLPGVFSFWRASHIFGYQCIELYRFYTDTCVRTFIDGSCLHFY